MRKKNNDGFTFLEVILSVSIISICLVVIIHSFSLALFAKAAADNYTKAMFLAQEKLFELNSGDISTADNHGQFPEPFEQFNWQIKADRTQFRDLAKVDLSVEWLLQGKLKKIQVSTIMEK